MYIRPMHSAAHKIKAYLNYRLRSVNRHGVHSPFVFELIEKVFRANTSPVMAPQIEKLRKALSRDHRAIDFDDMGAGAQKTRKEVTVSSITKSSLSSAHQAQLLWRLCAHLDINHVVELGSSLGLTAAYISQTVSSIDTIEGSQAVLEIAKENWKKLNCNNITSYQGNIDYQLKPLLESIERLDCAFIDGNHREQATINYFNLLLTKSHDDTLLIFDDIHWSEGMERAWAHIIADERVRVSIDLFWCGIVFLKPGLSKEHFSIRY